MADTPDTRIITQVEAPAEGQESVQEDTPRQEKKKYDTEKGIAKYKYTGKERFSIKKFDTRDNGDFKNREEAVEEFVDNLRRINTLQQRLYADSKEGVIFVFQAMDAAGKDGVIRTVFSTVSPHGVKEYCFKVPSQEEASHEFLWRFWKAMPPRGNISIFNRSYYEDVLIGKVHKLYEKQVVPDRLKGGDVIKQRYAFIKEFERFMYNTGTRVVKIFLNVSKDEQARRFVSRIDTPKKNWKLSANDIKERNFWNEYMDAFEKMVNNTSLPECPWYVVPSDHKWYARLIVSRIVLQTLVDMDPKFPTIADNELEEVMANRQALLDSIVDKSESEGAGSGFSETGIYASDILVDEENSKINEKKEKIRDSGFRTVQDLIAQGYIVRSAKDIVNAFGDSPKEEAKKKKLKKKEAKENEALDSAYRKFGIEKEQKVSKSLRKFLRAVNDLAAASEKADCMNVCSSLDIRPSEFEVLLDEASAAGLAAANEDGTVALTETGRKCILYRKADKKNEEKFKKFLKILNTEELNEFISLVDTAVDPAQAAAAAEAPEEGKEE